MFSIENYVCCKKSSVNPVIIYRRKGYHILVAFSFVLKHIFERKRVNLPGFKSNGNEKYQTCAHFMCKRHLHLHDTRTDHYRLLQQ